MKTAVRSKKGRHGRYGRSRVRRRRLVVVLVMLALALGAIPLYRGAEEALLRAMYPLRYEQTIREASEEQGLEPALVAGVVRTESRFDPDAESPQKAYGLMQILPETARFISGRSGVEGDYRDPETNLQLGTWYLGYLHRKYSGDETLMLAAYNSGEGQVEGWLREGRNLDRRIPFRETHHYVQNVLEAQDVYRELYGRNLNRD